MIDKEKRCTYIENMTNVDKADFDKAVDYICALCTSDGFECQSCELNELMSDVNFEFEERKI